MAMLISTISKAYNISPFEILSADFDDFALMVNYHLEKNNEDAPKKSTGNTKKENRIRVNDKTATGGWW